MNEDEAYLDIAKRFISSCERHIANNINIQEIIGFKSYHAFECLGGAFNSHFRHRVPRGHTRKINLFVTNANHHRRINSRSIATVAMVLASMRNKYLYPELVAGNFRCPKDQLSMTDAKTLVRRVKGILREVDGLI